MVVSEQTTTVEREIRIAARPETVFAYLIDPDRMMRWMGTEVSLEPRPGGALRVNVNGRHVAAGEFVAVEPARRVVFTWGWEGDDSPVPPGASTVEITLTPEAGGTLLRLSHRDLPAAVGEMHATGWQHYLDRLVIAGAGGDPGLDPMTQPQADQAAAG